jgi:hypothetical protein
MTEEDAIFASEKLAESFTALSDDERARRAEEAIVKLFQIQKLLFSSSFTIITDETRGVLAECKRRVLRSLNDPNQVQELTMLDINLTIEASNRVIRDSMCPGWLKGDKSVWVFF